MNGSRRLLAPVFTLALVGAAVPTGNTQMELLEHLEQLELLGPPAHKEQVEVVLLGFLEQEQQEVQQHLQLMLILQTFIQLQHWLMLLQMLE